MLRSIAASAVVALGLAACAQHSPPPPPPPGPPGQPAEFVMNGRVIEKQGQCHTIRGDNGTVYAADRGELAGIPAGNRVSFRGFVTNRQPCGSATHINITSVRPI